MPGIMRLQKIMAEAGLCSRREAEDLIKAGKVTVNGQIFSQPGAKVNPQKDHIKVNGKLLHGFEPKAYILLNKPKGFITGQEDERARPTVLSLLKPVRLRVFPVGRLDFNTRGVLLLTNDGELSRRLLLPKYKIPRVYYVKIQGIPDQFKLDVLSRGIVLDGIKTATARVRLKKVLKRNCWMEVILFEGKKRQIHRMLKFIGYSVKELVRVRFAFLDFRGLSAGKFRFLTSEEVQKLKSLVDL